MIEMELPWLLALLTLAVLLGAYIGAVARMKSLHGPTAKINDFINLLRGETHSPIDNMNFLLSHLREGGPETWTRLVTDLEDLNIEKAKSYLDGTSKRLRED